MSSALVSIYGLQAYVYAQCTVHVCVHVDPTLGLNSTAVSADIGCVCVQMSMAVDAQSLAYHVHVIVCIYVYMYVYVMLHVFLPTAMYEPLGGVFIGTGDSSKHKPALFVLSCGEGHLDLRTADKVHCVT